jgi:hypothetical protein
MTRPIDLLRQGRKKELWQMCCGFIDLSMEQFMDIQKALLLEQIELLKNCELGRKIMHEAMPVTIEEFREMVPLTNYGDYLPELGNKKENCLPAKVARWIRTSGHAGTYDVKWVPISEDFMAQFEKVAGGMAIFSTCNERFDLSNIEEHQKALHMIADAGQASGFLCELIRQALGYDMLPSNAEGMSFQERIRAGFEEAMYEGLDAFGGLSSVLVAIGEQFKQSKGKTNIKPLLSHPKALFRVTRGLVWSKLARRQMLPKDLWVIKGIGGGGTDNTVFKTKVKELWGRYPLELYAGTEGGIYATQTWDYEGMTFVPTLDFFEFIPEKDWFKWQLDREYQPKTILLDEVEAGENYELVITNFHGGIMTRYRPGDMIRIISLRNDKLDIDIPQMVFERRSDELIDISGFGRITEKVIWQAIENIGIPYVDWTARKEGVKDKPILHLYIELKGNYIASEKTIAALVWDELRKLDNVYHYNIYGSYGAPENILGMKPLAVSLLPQGAFARYIVQRQAEGADLGNLKPPHINPLDKVLSLLGAPRVVAEEVPVKKAARATASIN